MSLAHLIHRVVDGLWALGGIGAAAELGLEQVGPTWDEPCPCRACCTGENAGERKA